MQVFKNIYDYRELLKTNVKKDIRGKYKRVHFLGISFEASFLEFPLTYKIVVIIFVFHI